ncbi:hypothetical protein [Bacillus methanolicus]|uniref:Uncharacterized protein n=1 Tax=Bacillus methanolicus (strain MGA3 / ATCC 53907) TaxID=796606 RepID=I3EC67_BACMM|nr:hypothetical protein [Bacillus methanolicus]AIE61138.1 hypothetical protein BMMGA3_13740 [Bacillus methanolicus MGA3]EIJ84088.1 hypothetical protein MGA3_02315 [Bacillus methanolicus MGA3]UQD53114.1 hypothetical protein C0971_14425 [Bacillus methanolicus]
MTNEEEKKLMQEHPEEIKPFFEAPDGKILAIGDQFRGPYTGIFSDFDLENPSRPLRKKDDRLID